MIRTLAVTFLAVTLVACGDPLTKEEADRAWPATTGALYEGETDSGNQLTDAATNNGLFDASVSAPCAEGGSMKLTVSLSDIAAMTAGEFGYDVELNDCQNKGLTMNGEVRYTFGFETDATNTSMEWGWSGNLDYDGTLASPPCADTDCTVEGDCEFDTLGRLSVSSGTNAGDPSSLELEYSGNVCGYEAGTWLNLTTP